VRFREVAGIILRLLQVARVLEGVKFPSQVTSLDLVLRPVVIRFRNTITDHLRLTNERVTSEGIVGAPILPVTMHTDNQPQPLLPLLQSIITNICYNDLSIYQCALLE